LSAAKKQAQNFLNKRSDIDIMSSSFKREALHDAENMIFQCTAPHTE